MPTANLPGPPAGYTIDDQLPPPPSGYSLDTPGLSADAEKPGLLSSAMKAATAIPYIGPMVKEGQQMGSRMLQNLNPVPFLKAAAHPVNTALNVAADSATRAQQAKAALQSGQPGTAALRAAEAVPIAGPMVSQAEQDVKDKNYGGIAGTAASLALPSALKRINASIPLRSNLNPVEQRAVNFGQRMGVPVDVGTATDNPFVRTAQEAVARQPFTASKAATLRQVQDDAMGNVGRNLAYAASKTPVPVSPLEAGTDVQQGLTRRVNKLNAAADAGAQRFRQIAKLPQNTQRVQVGTTQTPGANPAASLTPAGMPITSPVYQDINLPVSRTATKAAISPIIKQLDETLPIAQRQASPGYQVLKQIMDGPDQVPASTAITDLSAVQNIARVRDELPAVRSASQGLAASAVPTMRQALDDAAASAGPKATQSLNQMRTATKSKYAVNAILQSLPDEPAQIYGRLTRAGDKSADILQDVQKRAPATLPAISRAYLDGLVDDMTYQGDLRRAQSAVRKWQAMGDKTKEILFPDPAIRQNITDFVNLAEMMTRRVNPSGSATSWAALAAMFHPKILASELLGGKRITDALFGGNGLQLAQQGIRLPFVGPTAAISSGAVVGANTALPDRHQQMSDYYSRNRR